MGKYGESFDKRFWDSVDIRTKEKCWNWLKSISGSGYGQVRVSIPIREKKNTHRVAYELFFGPIPKGNKVLHTCNNKRCVNPNHLKLGNQTINMQDSIEYYKGHYNQHHKRFDDSDKTIMSVLRDSGFSYSSIGEVFNCTGIRVSNIINN